MKDVMLDKIFGIMRRAYYGFFGVIFVGSILSLSYFYLFTDRADHDWERIGFICLLMLPVAVILHRAIHWVIWGKLS
jgi:hypothetical protein